MGLKPLAISLPGSGKWLLTMSTALCLLIPCAAQKLTLHRHGIAIMQVLAEIQRQAGYDVIYANAHLEDAPMVDVDADGADALKVLAGIFSGLALTAHLSDRTITIKREVPLHSSLYRPLRGQVQNGHGEALAGTTIRVNGIPRCTTDANGLFSIPVGALKAKLGFSFLGYSPQEAIVSNTEFKAIVLQSAVGQLDRVIVQAYGKTTQRLATASIVVVSDPPPGSTGVNIPEALEGKVPGMAIRQFNGVPGSAFGLLIRGRHSIAQGTDPLIVVDGIPLVDNDGYLRTIGEGSAQGAMGASVLNAIPPSAITSITVLKDAAATAIYGSRGANGVILLTLDTGRSRRFSWGVDVNAGADRMVKTSPLMNTAQYLGLRQEAVRNDGQKPDSGFVPEAYYWSSTQYTDFQKEVMGNTGLLRNARIDCSGGDNQTSFLLSGNYYHETAVFPGSTADDRVSVYGHLHRQSVNQHLRLDLSVLYSWENNRLPMQDYSYAMYLAPNAPAFSNAAGEPQWSSGGLSYVNIPALGYNTYHASVNNQFNHLQASWDLLPGLTLSGSLGYYGLVSDERSQLPIAGQDPASGPTGQTNYTGNTGHSELAEGLVHYSRLLGPGKLEGLLGLTWQEQRTGYMEQTASGYTSDLLLASGGGHPSITGDANSILYRYEAVFGRLNYILCDRYILTLSGRRDGSSRFGPGNQFGNFWAASAAWLFGDEPWVRKGNWLSFGKLRGSLGTTGNDQIGGNTFTQVYANTNAARNYRGQQGVLPGNIANNSLRWEVNYNAELALDLGFAQNKVLLSAAGYLDWTTNQLVNLSLPIQSGLPNVFSNVPASIVNEGLEFSLQTINWNSRDFAWTSTVNLTVPLNRLKRFPGLSASSYNQSLVVGKSLSVVKGYHFQGVSADSGLYEFRDVNHDGVTDGRDLIPGGNLDAHYFGGCDQRFRYRRLQLDLFFEFRGQSGYNPFVILYQEYPPGFQGYSMLGNGPVDWLRRWQRPGDHAPLQQVTESYGSVAYQRMQEYIGSDAQSIDASFIRWKGLSLSYQLPEQWLHALSVQKSQVYIRGQNLLTYTRFPVTDPETQDPTVLPPTRSLVAGINLTF